MNKSIKAIIVDDSAQARKLLHLMLQELAPEVDVLAEAKNVSEGLLAIEKYQPNVLFLDIEMPDKSGLQLAEELAVNNIDCEIVFTTAFNEYAIKAFRLSAIDYLLKPINETQLIQAVERIKEKQELKHAQSRLKALTQNLKADTEKVLSVPVISGYEYLPLHEIEYLEADGSYVHIFLLNGKHKTASKNLKYFEQILDSYPGFVRVHRSFLINLQNMVSFNKAGRGTLVMKNGKNIDLARDRRPHFFKVLEGSKS